MFSSIAGLYPSAPKCQHDLSPNCDNQKDLHTWPSIPWREKLPSAENHWPTWFSLDYFTLSLPDPRSATLRYLFFFYLTLLWTHGACPHLRPLAVFLLLAWDAHPPERSMALWLSPCFLLGFCSNVPKWRGFLLPPYVMAPLGLPWWLRQ